MKINILTADTSINYKLEKKIYIAYNLMTLSIISANNNAISYKDTIFWPDGVINSIFYKNKHIPGRFFLEDLLKIWKKNKNSVLFIGTFNNLQEKYLSAYKNCKLVNCIFGSSDQIFSDLKSKVNLIDFEFIVLCITSPKQESLARLLYINNKNTIYCFGAALNFLSGVERIPPSFIYKFGLEWFWRFFDIKNKRVSRFVRIISKIKFKELKKINYVRI